MKNIPVKHSIFSCRLFNQNNYILIYLFLLINLLIYFNACLFADSAIDLNEYQGKVRYEQNFLFEIPWGEKRDEIDPFINNIRNTRVCITPVLKVDSQGKIFILPMGYLNKLFIYDNKELRVLPFDFSADYFDVSDNGFIFLANTRGTDDLKYRAMRHLREISLGIMGGSDDVSDILSYEMNFIVDDDTIRSIKFSFNWSEQEILTERNDILPPMLCMTPEGFVCLNWDGLELVPSTDDIDDLLQGRNVMMEFSVQDEAGNMTNFKLQFQADAKLVADQLRGESYNKSFFQSVTNEIRTGKVYDLDGKFYKTFLLQTSPIKYFTRRGHRFFYHKNLIYGQYGEILARCKVPGKKVRIEDSKNKFAASQIRMSTIPYISPRKAYSRLIVYGLKLLGGDKNINSYKLKTSGSFLKYGHVIGVDANNRVYILLTFVPNLSENKNEINYIVVLDKDGQIISKIKLLKSDLFEPLSLISYTINIDGKGNVYQLIFKSSGVNVVKWEQK